MNSTKPKLETFYLNNPKHVLRWEFLVEHSLTPDVYYLPCYVNAYEQAGHGQGVAVVIERHGSGFLIPLLLRPLSQLPFEHKIPGFDATTPYGYGGILQLNGAPPSVQQFQEIILTFKQWCHQNDVISCLIRLHPLLHQELLFANPNPENFSELRRCGPTTSINLSEWNDKTQCITGMNKGRRSDLSRARRNLTTSWSNNDSDIHAVSKRMDHMRIFQRIYEITMDRLEADSLYRFPTKYYTALANGMGSHLDIAIAWHDEDPVAGAIFIAGREFAHYHLSGTTSLGRSYRATTLLLNSAVVWARNRGCKLLHLGGGVGSNDALFFFKQSFGGSIHNYAFETIIADQDRYRKLTLFRENSKGLPPPISNFFPRYRA